MIKSATHKLSAETVLNLLLAVLGILIVVESLRIGFGSLENPGSGLFAFLAGLLIFSSNVVLLFKEKPQRREIVFDDYGTRNFLFIGLTFVLWVVLMPLFGYVALTLVATFGLAKVMNLEGWLKPLLLSIGTTALCYLLFDYILYLDLPRGFWAG